MDSVTHIALGAAIGEVLIGRKIGKRAMVIGAGAQSLPDIDFVAALWLPPSENLIAHRGFTHSFLFAVIISLLLALLADRWHRRQSVYVGGWFTFFIVQTGVHLFIDGFNAYGVGWFEPFSQHRYSFNTLFVADPFFTFGVGVACIALAVLKSSHPSRLTWAFSGLVFTSVYLVYAVFNKLTIDSQTRMALAESNLSTKRYFTTPTPLNTWLWYVVAEDQHGFHVGYRSVFDKRKDIRFTYFLRNDSLLIGVADHESLQRLKRFSKGYYTAEIVQDTLVFNDLRFGQITGWHNPRAPFVFHYYLSHPDDNELVIQRGRFTNWNRTTVQSLLQRISGE